MTASSPVRYCELSFSLCGSLRRSGPDAPVLSATLRLAGALTMTCMLIIVEIDKGDKETRR